MEVSRIEQQDTKRAKVSHCEEGVMNLYFIDDHDITIKIIEKLDFRVLYVLLFVNKHIHQVVQFYIHRDLYNRCEKIRSLSTWVLENRHWLSDPFMNWITENKVFLQPKSYAFESLIASDDIEGMELLRRNKAWCYSNEEYKQVTNMKSFYTEMIHTKKYGCFNYFVDNSPDAVFPINSHLFISLYSFLPYSLLKKISKGETMHLIAEDCLISAFTNKNQRESCNVFKFFHRNGLITQYDTKVPMAPIQRDSDALLKFIIKNKNWNYDWMECFKRSIQCGAVKCSVWLWESRVHVISHKDELKIISLLDWMEYVSPEIVEFLLIQEIEVPTDVILNSAFQCKTLYPWRKYSNLLLRAIDSQYISVPDIEVLVPIGIALKKICAPKANFLPFLL